MLRLLSALLIALLPFFAHASSSQATVKRLENYLTELGTLVADFTQIAPDGAIASGTFFLQRPGKMRWQYDPPNPILMLSNGSYLTYYDYELEQVNDIPLDETLAGFLARPDIRFSSDAIRIVDLREGAGSIRITLQQVNDPENGTLTLEFADKPLELKNIVLMDKLQQVTRIALSNQRYGQELDASLFTFDDPRYKNRRNRR